MLGVVVAIVAALLVIGAVVTYRMARSNDTVESFRRQIDALSPEARRGAVDQVNRIDDAAIDNTRSTAQCDRRRTMRSRRPADRQRLRPTTHQCGGPDAPPTAGADTADRPDDDIAGRPDDEHGS